MKAIVICEPSCNGQTEKDGSPEIGSNKSGMKAMDASSAAEDDALSDIEICEVVKNVGECVDRRKSAGKESVKSDPEDCERRTVEDEEKGEVETSTLEPYVSIEESCANFDSAMYDSCSDSGIVENGELNNTGSEQADGDCEGEKCPSTGEKGEAAVAGEVPETSVSDVQLSKSQFIDEILIDEDEEEDKENRRTAGEGEVTAREDKSVDECKNGVLDPAWEGEEREEGDDGEENNEESDCIIASECNDEGRERDDGCVADDKPENGVFDEESKLEMEVEENEESNSSEEKDSENRKRKVLEESEEASAKKRKTLSEDDSNSNSNGPAAFSENSKPTSDTTAEKDCEEPKEPEKAGEEAPKRNSAEFAPLPFIESLRGKIKTLSRGDLEELIVQKLCEVITERSTVGDLRQRAQALERDQERWKEKVQSLTKQLREMDMVMKKYMTEVQKQNKERNFQLLAPLRVTRSVGLQVSFNSSNSKKLASNAQGKHNSQSRAKQSTQQTVNTSPSGKKSFSVQPSSKVRKPVYEQKKQCSQRQGGNATFQTRVTSPQNVAAQNRTLQQTQQVNSVNRARHPPPEQNSSKVIDLTDDDDRQNSQTIAKAMLPPNVTVRSPGQIKIVSHLQQTQLNSGGRVAYLVPASTAPGGGSAAPPQSRLLIAAPAMQQQQQPRQIIPSVPPLLYKGSTMIQPQSQQSTPIYLPPKTSARLLKHPAPLPQPPLNQIQKPNWKLLPPKPALKVSKVQTGIVLSWNMTLGPEYEPIASYQLYAYQENSSPPTTSLWKKVGDVKALPLPMACTLTQFMSGHKYYFAVRAVDHYSRIGSFSSPVSIVLVK
ncbi:UNVERIFIED_CONTAM: hypothetical protein PYX00_007895 [Menopon gallinae]|uniref:Fibronectin type-III domain-containing protein n=1 Tax=Menopon gallinae TaxID=328185 RepID=A0AAW2HL05_9NEOP